MYRKGVSALIINNKNEFLLVNLESFEDKYFAIPGGGVELGETLENAVYREIHEELSIEKKSLQFVGQSDIPVRFKFKLIKMIRDDKDYEGSERYFFGFCFVGDNNEIKPKKGEVRFYKWIPLIQLKDYLLFDGQLKDTQEKIKEIFSDLQQIQTGDKKMETVLQCVIDVSEKTLKEMAETLGMSWVNPRVTDTFYPFRDSFLGKWKVEVQRLRRKEKFEEIVRATREDNWQPATIYHLLTLLTSPDSKHLSGSFMAPGSLCIDDFEYPGCVVLSIKGEDKKIGLGNWRGSKIGGYDVVRVKRE